MKYTDEQVQEMLQGGMVDKINLAEKGQALDILVHDENWVVRHAVAKQGYRLDILMYDEDWAIRREVVNQGYALDILVHDKEYAVRREVARLGYGLDILVHDENTMVREIAEKLLGSERYVIKSNFGTYNGDLLLYVWDDRYLVVSGCYEADDLSVWQYKCAERLDRKVAMECTNLMVNFLKEVWK